MWLSFEQMLTIIISINLGNDCCCFEYKFVSLEMLWQDWFEGDIGIFHSWSRDKYAAIVFLHKIFTVKKKMETLKGSTLQHPQFLFPPTCRWLYIHSMKTWLDKHCFYRTSVDSHIKISNPTILGIEIDISVLLETGPFHCPSPRYIGFGTRAKSKNIWIREAN